MLLSTASEAISLIRRLEELSASFYETIAEAFPEHRETFKGFAAENRRFVSQLERTYYGVISDALEGGFAFRIPREDYDFELPPDSPKDPVKALEMALEMEGKILGLCEEAARQSKPLIADISRVLELAARKRRPRAEVLRALIPPGGPSSPRE